MEKFMFQDRSPKDREQLLRDNATKVESRTYLRALDPAEESERLIGGEVEKIRAVHPQLRIYQE